MIYVLLADGLEEIEALAPVDFLRRANLPVTTVALRGDGVLGAHAIRILADATLSEVDFSDADAIVLPGGLNGTLNLDADPRVERLLSDVAASGGVLAAICAAPLVLGKRGYLQGKEAVCYPGFESDLKGARISDRPVVRDGRILTAKSAGFAWQFGYELARFFADASVCEKVRESLFLPEYGDLK